MKHFVKVHRFKLGLALITAVGLILRFRGLHEKPLWQDETAFWMESLGIDANTADPFLPRLLAYAWMWLTQDPSLDALHFLPALSGGMAVFVFGYLVKELVSYDTKTAHRAGWMGAALFAVWPQAIIFSREARPYGFFLFAVTLLHLTFLRVRRQPTIQSFVAYSFAVTVAVGSHYNSALILAGFAVVAAYEAWRSKSYKKLAALGLTTFLGCLPALLTMRVTYVGLALLPRQYVSLYKFLLLFVKQLGPGFFFRRTGFPWEGALYLLLVGGGAWQLAHSRQRRELGVFAAVTAFSLVAVYYFLGERVFWGIWPLSRYLVHLVVPACALATLSLVALTRRVSFAPPLLMGLAVFISLSLRLPTPLPETPYHEIAADLRIQKDLDGVIVGENRLAHSVAYYYGDTLPFYLMKQYGDWELWEMVPVRSAGQLRTMWELSKRRTTPLRGKYALVFDAPFSGRGRDLCRSLKGRFQEGPTPNLAYCEGPLIPILQADPPSQDAKPAISRLVF